MFPPSLRCDVPWGTTWSVPPSATRRLVRGRGHCPFQYADAVFRLVALAWNCCTEPGSTHWAFLQKGLDGTVSISDLDGEKM